MMRRFELFVLLSFAAAYFIRVFGFTEPTSHFGPFADHSKKVRRIRRDEEGEIEDIYEAPVTLIDQIRRLTPMNPYVVDGDNWGIDDERIQVWECPKCLSPYVALAVVVPFTPLTWIPAMWAAVTGGGYFIYTITEYLWTQIAVEENVAYALEGSDPDEQDER